MKRFLIFFPYLTRNVRAVSPGGHPGLPAFAR